MNVLFCLVMVFLGSVFCFLTGSRAGSKVALDKLRRPLEFLSRLAATTSCKTIQDTIEKIDSTSPLLLPSHPRFVEVENLYKSLECDPELVDLRIEFRLAALTGEWDTLATDLRYLQYEAPVHKLLYLPEDLLCAKAMKQPLVAKVVGLMQTVGEIDNFDCTFAMVTLGNCQLSQTKVEINNRLDVEFVGKSMKVVEGNAAELSKLYDYLGDKTKIEAFVNQQGISLKGWSDVVYLDNEAKLRVMKGNAGNFYILKKKT